MTNKTKLLVVRGSEKVDLGAAETIVWDEGSASSEATKNQHVGAKGVESGELLVSRPSSTTSSMHPTPHSYAPRRLWTSQRREGRFDLVGKNPSRVVWNKGVRVSRVIIQHDPFILDSTSGNAKQDGGPGQEASGHACRDLAWLLANDIITIDSCSLFDSCNLPLWAGAESGSLVICCCQHTDATVGTPSSGSSFIRLPSPFETRKAVLTYIWSSTATVKARRCRDYGQLDAQLSHSYTRRYRPGPEHRLCEALPDCTIP